VTSAASRAGSNGWLNRLMGSRLPVRYRVERISLAGRLRCINSSQHLHR
jgi:hypothetical protein